MKIMKAGIIGAMEMEVETLKTRMENVSVTEKAGMAFYEGILCGMPAVVVRSGVGKVNAALCTQILADLFSVDAIVNTGAAGSLDDEISIGDIVISTDAVYHDVDATVFGYAPGEVPQLGVCAFPACEELMEEAEAAFKKADPSRKVFRGRIVSGDQFIVSRERKNRIREVFQGKCTEMEGAAIAQGAYLNGIPFIIVRAVSDKADGSEFEEYPVFEQKAAACCAEMTAELMKRLSGLSGNTVK